MLKKWNIFLLLVLSISSISIIIISLFFPLSIGEPMHLRVGSYENPPKVYTDENNNHIGLFPDLLKYIATQEGWELEYVDGNWTQCLDRLENNELDVMVDVAFSNERAEIYDFNQEEIFTNWGIVFIKGGSNIESLFDLNNKTIAVMSESIHTIGSEGIMNLTKRFNINCTFVEYANYQEVFEVLNAGGADAGVVNRLFGILFSDDYNISETSIIFDPCSLKFAFPKNSSISQYLIERIDAHLALLKKDSGSIYYELLTKYIFGKQESLIIIPEWVLPVILSSSGLVLIFVFISFILKRKVNIRTAELKASEKDYREAYQRVDFYKDLFTHDINNILQNLLSGMELCNMMFDNPEEVTSYLNLIETQIIRGSRLVSNIRKISQIDRDEKSLKRTEIYNILDDVVNYIKLTFKDKEINIRVDSFSKQIYVKANSFIGDVFENILINAIKHSLSLISEIDIKIGRDQKSDANYIKMEFKDNGIGITDAWKEKIFQRESTRDSNFKGIGLGLSLVKKVIGSYNGKIWVEDRIKGDYSKGSNFILLIPELKKI